MIGWFTKNIKEIIYLIEQNLYIYSSLIVSYNFFYVNQTSKMAATTAQF